jgi:Flp pilus assembly protein TadD
MNDFLPEFRAIEALISFGQLKAALQRLIKLSQSYPENYQVASMMGELYLNLGSPHKAIRPLQWATKRYLQEKGFKGSMQKSQEELAFVEQLKEKTKEQQENLVWNVWVNHYLLGSAYCRCQKFKSALRHLNLADAINPNNPEILRNIGWVEVMQGRCVNGRAILMRSITLDPDNAQAYNDLGASYLFEQNFPEAKKWIDQAIRLDPHDPLIRETADQIDELEAYQKLYQPRK